MGTIVVRSRPSYRYRPRRRGGGGQVPPWVVVAGVVVLVIGARETVPPAPAAAEPVTASCTAGPAGGVAGFGAEQIGNATVIVAVGRELGAPERAWVIALATAMQESSLRNIDHGDRDSLGLYQQRPSQGWGSPAQVTDPRYAARIFYERLLAIPGWDAMALTEAAQRVQRSAHPNAYAKWEDEAATVLAATSGAITCIPT